MFWVELKRICIICEMADRVNRIKRFVEYEARACSMDFGCVTAKYVYRVWGGSVALDEVAQELSKLRK